MRIKNRLLHVALRKAEWSIVNYLWKFKAVRIVLITAAILLSVAQLIPVL